MSKQDSEKYLLESIRLAMGNVKGRERATWPFGAVLVRDGTGRRLAELARVDGLDPVTGDYRLISANQTQGDTP